MMLIGGQAIVNFFQQGARIESKGLANAANQTLQTYLSSETICSNAITPFVLDPSKKNNIEFNIPGIGLFSVGKENSALNVDVKTLNLNNLVLAEENKLKMKIYVGLLKSSFSKKNGGITTDFKENAVGSLALMTNSDGLIIKCLLGNLSFHAVPQDNPVVPTGGSGGDSTTIINNIYGGSGGIGNGATAATKIPICNSVEQCAIYDYYLRNGIPNPFASADKWMNSNNDWKTIATSYIGTMSTLGKLNFLASIDQAGLVQTGLNGFNGISNKPDTIDQWVADAIRLDPAGRVMLSTNERINVISALFDPGANTPTTAQAILRTALTKSADITMNSSLGISAWVKALGYENPTQFATALPEVAIRAAMSPGAGKDGDNGAALMSVMSYIKQNPDTAITIANGTGLWAKNVNGNISTVVDYIKSNLASTGSTTLAMDVASATSQWAGVIGSQAVGRAISTDASTSLNIASGTSVWNNAIGSAAVTKAIANDSAGAANIASGTTAAVAIFGQAAVSAAIKADTGAAAQGAAAISAAKAAGYSDADIKAYIQANPNTWSTWHP